MKRITAALSVSLLIAAGVVASPASASRRGPRTDQVMAVAVTQGDITVDGTLNETAWRQGSARLPYKVSRTIEGTWTNQIQYGLAWDTTYLFVGIHVTDPSLRNDSADTSHDDAIEIYVDGDYSRGPVYDPQDNRIVVGYGDTGVSFSGRRSGDLMHQSRATPDGYQVEIAIPWSILDVTPRTPVRSTSGRSIGFDLGNTDDRDGGARDGYAMAFGGLGNPTDTSAFGTLVLGGKPGPTIAAGPVGEGVIDVDGELAEPQWLLRTPDLPYWLHRVVEGEVDNMTRYSALWSRRYLYVAVRVFDRDVIDGDSVEVHLDAGRSVRYTKRWNHSGLFSSNGDTRGILHALQPTSGGYQLELAVPHRALGPPRRAGRDIGFDVAVNDVDPGGKAGKKLAFGTPHSIDPATYGTLTLARHFAERVAPGTVTLDGALTEQAWRHGQDDLPYHAPAGIAYSALWDGNHLYLGVRAPRRLPVLPHLSQAPAASRLTAQGWEAEFAIRWSDLGVTPREWASVFAGFLGGLTLSAGGTAAPMPFGHGSPGGPAGEWTLTFADEFNLPGVDLQRWGIGYGWGNKTGHSIEWVDRGHTTVSDGNLVFTVAKDGDRYRSGAVNTDNAVQPFGQVLGYFETRYRAARPKGLISAFWGKRLTELWPPELDVNETFDRACDATTIRQSRALTSVHWGPNTAHEFTNRNWCYPDNGEDDNDAADAFHTYAVEWRTDAVIMFVDGVERARITSADGVDWDDFNAGPFYWMLNVHVCGHRDTGCHDPGNAYPATMEVDYVRIWRRR